MPEILSFDAAAGMEPDLLGGKGAGLAAMTSRGFPVPPGFVITTPVCRQYQETGSLPAAVRDGIETALADLERTRGLRLGDPDAPLLVAVRSGAPVSMPGMMDTVLNLGVSARTRPALERQFGTRFALDSHRRFLESFGTVVLGIPQEDFTAAAPDTAEPSELADAYERLLTERPGGPVDDPRQQLTLAVEAVLRSWNSPRAKTYRRLEGIPDDLGTAVVVQSMVFGNRDEHSGTGVAFTRNPNTGEKTLYGDFIFQAQGEDVVSGRHRTLPLDALRDRLPGVWDELCAKLRDLEAWRADMLDIEFTIEHGELYLLQVRTAKRAAAAAVRVAVEMVSEGLISTGEALRRVSPAQLEALDGPHVAPDRAHETLATGLPASPGVGVGAVCLTPEAVTDLAQQGVPAVLVRQETSPADVHGMALAEAIVTTRGGLVSHAAVVARGLGVPAVVGAESLEVDMANSVVRCGDRVVKAGEIVTVDGAGGLVALGELEVVRPQPPAEVATLLSWADEAGGPASPEATPSDRLAAARAALGPHER